LLFIAGALLLLPHKTQYAIYGGERWQADVSLTKNYPSVRLSDCRTAWSRD
jgi:hypothetical protein